MRLLIPDEWSHQHLFGALSTHVHTERRAKTWIAHAHYPQEFNRLKLKSITTEKHMNMSHTKISYYYYYYYYSTGFYNPLAGFSLLSLEVSRSHTMTQHSR